MNKTAIALALGILLGACAYQEPTRNPETIQLEAGELGIPNGKSPFPGVMTGGQPSRRQFVALSESGYKTFINLRVPSEDGTGWERKLTGELGARYYSIPVAGAEGLTEGNAIEFAAVLAQSRGPYFVYCASGNRVVLRTLGTLYCIGDPQQKYDWNPKTAEGRER